MNNRNTSGGGDLPLTPETIERFNEVGKQLDGCVKILVDHQEFLIGERDRHAAQPYCKIIQNYLRIHQAKDLLDLPPANRNELLRVMNAFFARLKKESDEMLAVYGATDEHQLAPNQREIYYTRMKALVDDMDHYP